jgi:hypothetical protein
MIYKNWKGGLQSVGGREDHGHDHYLSIPLSGNGAGHDLDADIRSTRDQNRHEIQTDVRSVQNMCQRGCPTG